MTAAEFELGTPALVCRWRLSAGTLPCENRHMRALLARTVQGQRVTSELAAWAKQHLEWTLPEGTAEHPNGVLMLVIDEAGQAAMSVGPYEPLFSCAPQALQERAARAAQEARSTGVAPEALIAVSNNSLIVGLAEKNQPSGVMSLVLQLAGVHGYALAYEPQLNATTGELALISDEHGVVLASDSTHPMLVQLAQDWQTLLAKAKH